MRPSIGHGGSTSRADRASCHHRRMTTTKEDRASAPPSSTSGGPRSRRWSRLAREPAPGAPPGTLMIEAGDKPKIFLLDYCATHVVEKELGSIDEAIPYLTDDEPSITWIDLRGLCDKHTLERAG